MKVETDDLVKVSTYAKSIDKSATWVRTLIKENKIKSVRIDGVDFIISKKWKKKPPYKSLTGY